MRSFLASWTSSDWSAAGSLLLATGAIIGGIWTVFNYKRTRRYEAAKWLKELFTEFYIKDTFSKIRIMFEYNYSEGLGGLIERRVTDRDLPLSDDDISVLKELDTLLNYFEHVLYLEKEGQMEKSDREAVFDYWFKIMEAPECGGLRRYIDTLGFERLEEVLSCTQNKEYIVLYGSLMESFGELNTLKVEGKLKFVSLCDIRGAIYDLGDYPGLSIEEGIVKGELYEICDLSALKTLDDFERYLPENYKDSLYIRTCLKLLNPAVDAWIYVYNKEIPKDKKVVSGNWKEYKAEKSES